jgi:hypothetical protein
LHAILRIAPENADPDGGSGEADNSLENRALVDFRAAIRVGECSGHLALTDARDLLAPARNCLL